MPKAKKPREVKAEPSNEEMVTANTNAINSLSTNLGLLLERVQDLEAEANQIYLKLNKVLARLGL